MTYAAPDWQSLTTTPNELGESPFWHPQHQMLYWVDIPGRLIQRANITTGAVEAWPMPEEPGCIAPLAGGGLVIALRNGIFSAKDWGGELVRLTAAPYDTATTRFNDGKADPLGRFWSGTIYEPRNSPNAELFSLDCRTGLADASGQPTALALQRMAGNATVANGLAWSPDARTLYWSDTFSHAIRAFDWDAASNALSNERIWHQFDLKPKGWAYASAGRGAPAFYGGRPDGAAVDVQGNYFVAMFEGQRVLKMSPAGEVLAQIPVPAMCPTMPCFGGPDLQTLYLTTGRHGRSAQELADFPLSGCVLALRLDVPGLPVNFVQTQG